MNNIELKTEKQLVKHLIMNEVTWQQVRNMLGEERASERSSPFVRGSPQIIVFCFYVHFAATSSNLNNGPPANVRSEQQDRTCQMEGGVQPSRNDSSSVISKGHLKYCSKNNKPQKQTPPHAVYVDKRACFPAFRHVLAC